MFWLALLLAVVGATTAVAIFVRTPDLDRRRAYPNNPEAWFGASGEGTHSRLLIARSPLFWSAAAATTGVLAAILGFLLPHTATWMISGTLGVLVAAYACSKLLRWGPGMIFPMAPQTKTPTGTERSPRVLFICGSPNQTTQMHQIANELGDEIDAHFSPYFSDHWVWVLFRKLFQMEFAICGYKRRGICLDYLVEQGLAIDLHGEKHQYNLVLSPNDQLLPPTLKNVPMVLVQEGIQDPPNWRTRVWQKTRLLHRVFAGTSTFGLSNKYEQFCVASEGYRDHFVALGVPPEKLTVTGMPNFDNFARFRDNDFPHKDYVLVCTTDARETMAEGDREAFLKHVVTIAGDRQLIFKLHPNEKFDRAIAEIKTVAPKALVYTSGSAEEMVANCRVLITEWSSLTFCGLALDKEVHSYHPIDNVRRLLPLQHGCAARNIATVCRDVLVAHRQPVQQNRQLPVHSRHASAMGD